MTRKIFTEISGFDGTKHYVNKNLDMKNQDLWLRHNNAPKFDNAHFLHCIFK